METVGPQRHGAEETLPGEAWGAGLQGWTALQRHPILTGMVQLLFSVVTIQPSPVPMIVLGKSVSSHHIGALCIYIVAGLVSVLGDWCFSGGIVDAEFRVNSALFGVIVLVRWLRKLKGSADDDAEEDSGKDT